MASASPASRQACAAGALIRSPGRAVCLQIDFTPQGAFRFFGGTVQGLTDRCVPLEGLGEPAILRLRERLAETTDWRRLLDLAERFVRHRLDERSPCHPAVDWAMDRLIVTGGRATIAGLAREIGWSRKHLAARFREQVGLPPKLFGRIARFETAQARVRAAPEAGWAATAVFCGYADQAHLVRDFGEFAGLTPAGSKRSIRTARDNG